jgi:hypothetical protein
MKTTVAGLIELAGESLTFRRETLSPTTDGEVIVDSTTDVACFGAPTPYMLSDADGRVMQAGDIVIEVEALSFDSTGITPKPDDLVLYNSTWWKIQDSDPRRFQGETVSYSFQLRGGE